MLSRWIRFGLALLLSAPSMARSRGSKEKSESVGTYTTKKGTTVKPYKRRPPDTKKKR